MTVYSTFQSETYICENFSKCCYAYPTPAVIRGTSDDSKTSLKLDFNCSSLNIGVKCLSK